MIPAPAPAPAATPALARASLAAWGVQAASLRCVSTSDCTIWRVRPVGATGDLALRLYPSERQDVEVIDQELDWLQALHQHGLHVPAPMACTAGGWRVGINADGRTRQAVLLRWLGGRQRFASLRPRHLHQAGQLVAALHAHASGLESAGRLQPLRPVHGPDLEGWARGARTLPSWTPARLRRALPAAATRLLDELAGWRQRSAPVGWIHGDLHPWNLVFTPGRAGAIDFSDGGWGLRALDLAALLQFLRHPIAGHHDHRAAYPALRQALFEGYASRLPLPPLLREQAERLIVWRQLNTLQWLLDDWAALDERLWGPAFVATLAEHLND